MDLNRLGIQNMDTMDIERDYHDSGEGTVYRIDTLAGSNADEALKRCFFQREQPTIGNKKGWLTEVSGYGDKVTYKLLLDDTAPASALFQ